MPISIRFRIRPPKKGQARVNFAPIQVRLKIDRTTTAFAAVWKDEKLVVSPAKWSIQKRRSTERACLLNDDLDALDSEIRRINRSQREQSRTPTALSVQYQLIENEPPVWTGAAPAFWEFPRWLTKDSLIKELSGETDLVDIIRAYLLTVVEPGSIDRSTKHRWRRLPDLVKAYSPKITPRQLSDLWGSDFCDYLLTRRDDRRYPDRGMTPHHAGRYVRMVSMVLDWMVRGRWLRKNELSGYQAPKGVTKDIYYLEPEQVYTLMQTRLTGSGELARWWFCLMCVTGLDYPDAIAYVANRKSLEQMGKYGMKLIGKRKKAPNNEFDVPLLDEVSELFAEYPKGPGRLSPQTLNKKTDVFEYILSFERNITIKTARKTFGALMLYKGYRIQEVSRMLGHSSIKTTEVYYIKVLGTMVDAGMKRVQEKQEV